MLAISWKLLDLMLGVRVLQSTLRRPLFFPESCLRQQKQALKTNEPTHYTSRPFITVITMKNCRYIRMNGAVCVRVTYNVSILLH